MGSCGLDYLAQVASFPKPDDKLRTENLQAWLTCSSCVFDSNVPEGSQLISTAVTNRLNLLQTQGGGNCANALTAASRLGLNPLLITKIGDDAVGDDIVKELESDRVKTDYVLRAKGCPSPFTYIIVDREGGCAQTWCCSEILCCRCRECLATSLSYVLAGGTRTCIHTPAAPLAANDLSASRIEEALSGAALVYFDGRLAEAALQIAKAARRAGIPILVEAERLRPGLNELLAHADYVVTSTQFPKVVS